MTSFLFQVRIQKLHVINLISSFHQSKYGASCVFDVSKFKYVTKTKNFITSLLAVFQEKDQTIKGPKLFFFKETSSV